jgi:hypothetical protein
MQFISAGNSFEIKSSLDKDTVSKILGEKVAKDEGFSLMGANVFVGRVDQDGFEIGESWGFFRLFNPTYYGTFVETNEGVVIKVKASGGLAQQNRITYWVVSGVMLIISASRWFRHDYKLGAGFLVFSTVSACFAFGMGRIYDERLRAGKEKLISLFALAERKSPGGHREQLQKQFFDKLSEPRR